jgi:SET domain-containing protein
MKKTPSSRRTPLFEVRHSRIHGHGVFALRRIRKNTELIEYLGERISHAEADRRYAGKDANDNHTFLFMVDARTVIDAAVGGNDARYFNHSCDPNCESYTDRRRIFIKAVRTIQPGEELFYDYEISRDRADPPDIDAVFACRCGAAACRGSMLEAAKPARKAVKAKRPPAKRAAGRAAAAGRAPARVKRQLPR